ncbi:hypothetical protein EDD16DRAFT_1522853 [Pisolithus croceorrhizus]|nr:hypothetical protein EDD16DRAFT_1522853 [Pisolithus croceorrhizus]KAI6124917.1 hypothetical protein EV401DRAFT_1886197 [Pisolithus croceorrhizus]KAI6160635.1 hypothetical protein EDD17DRAFT_1510076 [Pisolithus thermaeus]
MKAGPGKGKSFKVPTIPIACDCSAPQAVQWIIAVFHSFKAHLNPIALDPQSGRVLPGWFHLYQNNLYVHLQSQLRTGLSPTQAPTSPPKPPPHLLCLCSPQPLLTLCLSFRRSSDFSACCGYCSNPPSSSSESSSKADSTLSHLPLPVSPFTILDNSPKGPVLVSDPPTWLIAALQHPDIPDVFTGKLYSPGPPDCHFPSMVLTTIKLVFSGSTPLYLGVKGDHSLYIATMADCSLVAATIKLPADPSVPMIHP